MKNLFNYKVRFFCGALVALTIGLFNFSGTISNTVNAQKTRVVIPETNTPQALPFSQNWTTTTLITANDDWSGVPGVVGFLGDYDVNAPTAVDPRTLLTPFVTNNVDVIANQSNVGITNGGVAEFDGIANPVVALNGSGTADAPHIIIYVNTTGLTNIQFACNIRDIDNTVDDAAQQVDVQYRVGGSGNYASVTGGYIADATTGGTATQVTPLNLTLPAGANNQSQVEIRVMTTNAIGNDEWVGVDDISVTGTSSGPVQHIVDMNGDGKTDYSVVRNTGGGPGGQVTWFTGYNGAGEQTDSWGIATDFFVPGDYDGDNKTDVSVWRPGVSGAWYTLQSSTGTLRGESFGTSGDDPTVLGDYDNDGKEDIAVYRPGANPGNPSTWFWRTALNGPVSAVQWGQNGDFTAPGDYDGDGKNDFVIQRNAGGGQARFWRLFATGSVDSLVFGTPADAVVPGDYDGDGKTDIATARAIGGQILWWVHPSAGGADVATFWGSSATDYLTQGDYDGDGKTDHAIWRPNADPTQNFFYVNRSNGGGLLTFEWGQNGDFPVANYNSH